MSNPLRAEKTLTIDGKDYTLRPTLACFSSIEGKLGKGIMAILLDIPNPKTMSFTALRVIFNEGIKAGLDGGKMPAPFKVDAAMQELGIARCCNFCAEFIQDGTKGPDDDEVQESTEGDVPKQ